MRIVVVEPHVDDAFLSLGWHLERLWAEFDRTIITVYSDPARDKEAVEYAAAVGAKSVSLGLSESPMQSNCRPQTINALRSELDDLKLTPDDRVYFPLGLQHPDHLSVAATRPVGAMRYIDTPYQLKQKLSDSLLDRCEGMRLASICYPPKLKWRHVPIFKSQAKFFHFNPMHDLRLAEIVLETLS